MDEEGSKNKSFLKYINPVKLQHQQDDDLQRARKLALALQDILSEKVKDTNQTNKTIKMLQDPNLLPLVFQQLQLLSGSENNSIINKNRYLSKRFRRKDGRKKSLKVHKTPVVKGNLFNPKPVMKHNKKFNEVKVIEEAKDVQILNEKVKQMELNSKTSTKGLKVNKEKNELDLNKKELNNKSKLMVKSRDIKSTTEDKTITDGANLKKPILNYQPKSKEIEKEINSKPTSKVKGLINEFNKEPILNKSRQIDSNVKLKTSPFLSFKPNVISSNSNGNITTTSPLQSSSDDSLDKNSLLSISTTTTLNELSSPQSHLLSESYKTQLQRRHAVKLIRKKTTKLKRKPSFQSNLPLDSNLKTNIIKFIQPLLFNKNDDDNYDDDDDEKRKQARKFHLQRTYLPIDEISGLPIQDQVKTYLNYEGIKAYRKANMHHLDQLTNDLDTNVKPTVNTSSDPTIPTIPTTPIPPVVNGALSAIHDLWYEDFSPAKDCVSVYVYWWGYEVYLPKSVLEKLKKQGSNTTAILGLVQALTAAVPFLQPIIKILSAFISMENSASDLIKSEQGTVLAAAWVLPFLVVPRAWY